LSEPLFIKLSRVSENKITSKKKRFTNE